MRPLTVGQVAARAGVAPQTVRFYEREGLIGEPPRKPSGYRQYSGDVILRLRFIRRARELGFALDEIAELLSLRVDSAARCGDVKRRAEARIADLDARIRALARMRETLSELVDACDARAPTSECPILAALEAEEEKR